jgi:hypothetical protein
MNELKREESTFDDPRTRMIGILIAVIMVLMVFAFFVINVFVAISDTKSAYFSTVLKDHLPVFLGFPQIAAVSFAFVVFLRQTDGPFEFKCIGIEFSGASGQVFMWIVTFMCMTLAMHMVW